MRVQVEHQWNHATRFYTTKIWKVKVNAKSTMHSLVILSIEMIRTNMHAVLVISAQVGPLCQNNALLDSMLTAMHSFLA